MALRFILANKTISTTYRGMRTAEHRARCDMRVSDGVGLPAELITRLRAHRWDRKVAPWSD
jgi:hypothetical protein